MLFELLDSSFYDALLSCLLLIPAGVVLAVIFWLFAVPVRVMVDALRG